MQDLKEQLAMAVKRLVKHVLVPPVHRLEGDESTLGQEGPLSPGGRQLKVSNLLKQDMHRLLIRVESFLTPRTCD